MTPERAAEILYHHAGRFEVHPGILDAIIAAAAEARREALGEAIDLCIRKRDKDPVFIAGMLNALRDRVKA